jgi:hypothetical protein
MEKRIDVKNLLMNYKDKIINAEKIIFKLADIKDSNKDVYNITAPFKISNQEYIAGRVESRDGHDSKIMFFIKEGSVYIVDEKAPILDLEDPFITVIENVIILGGVEVNSEKVYRTVFFRGNDIYNLKRFKEGPVGMKDIRLILLPDKRISIFTRPQGEIGKRGRIGFMTVNSIEDFSKLSDSDFYSAKLLPDVFDDNEWLGVNAVFILKNNTLGVLGHIACFSEKENINRNYYPITFNFDPVSNDFSGMKIIASRNLLPPGESKREDLANVIFPGGLVRNSDGTASLYVGAGDAEAYKITIIDPLLEYEHELEVPCVEVKN